MVKGTFSHAISGSRVAAVEITRNKSRNVSHLVESFFPPFLFLYIFIYYTYPAAREKHKLLGSVYIVCS